ncbi:MAG: hypothetical protein ACK2U3_17910 [Anaerolineales bacterium]
MKKTFVTIGITVFVVGIALFGTAYLALAQGENIINVCVAKDGSMRVVAGEEQCKNKETPLSWNKQGEPGPAGVLGFYTVTSELVVRLATFETYQDLTARCDVGDSVTGGGFRLSEYSDLWFDWYFTDKMVPISSQPIDASDGLGEGWRASALFGDYPASLKMEVFAVCADLTP